LLLIPCVLCSLCADIIRSYTLLDDDTQQRNIVAWRPVVVDVLEGYTNFPTPSFDKHIETFYPLAVALLERDLGSSEVRNALWALLRRVGEVRMGMAELPTPSGTPSATPTSPGLTGRRGTQGSYEWSRRNSRVGR
jgi:brefeldin A-inhibited guanine nucleotide-exchange protein